MFKKTLAAVAVLGAFAGSALAADVTLYGVVDLGLKYTHVDPDDGTSSTDNLEMKSGGQSGSRFGLKGSEDLGDGLKVGFVLENGFDADTGSLGNNGRLFGREAQVNLSGAFGEVSFGRVGQLTSGNGTYGLAGALTPFGTSFAGSVESSTYFVGYSRMDNTITYKSPSFAGLNVYAQYSFDVNSKGSVADTEGKSSANRYYALGATYANGGLKLVGTVDGYNWSTKRFGKDVDDGYAVTFGGSYDFQVAKAYVGMQYFDNMYKTTADDKDTSDSFAKVGAGIDGQIEGYGVTVGADAPVMGGTAMLAVGYTDTEATEGAAESTRYGASVGYTYSLSKRTNVYGVAAWYQDKIENVAGKEDRDPSTATVYVGLRHKF